jgi:hypothetical protein
MWRAARGLAVLLFAAPFALAPYTGDDAIAHLRFRLRTRGYTTEVTAGPMLALWTDDAPSPPLRFLPTVDPGAYLVLTNGGAWWVWGSGQDLGPIADPASLLSD